MGLADKFIKREPEPPVIVNNNSLTIEELDYVLRLLKTTTIQGDQVEMFYNLVIKLQNQYIEHTKK